MLLYVDMCGGVKLVLFDDDVVVCVVELYVL